jgi:hypothetical protein
MGIWACQAGKEVFDVAGLSDAIRPRSEVTVTAVTPDGSKKTFQAIARLDSAVEANYYRNGGILPTVLRSLLKPAWSGERLQSLWCNRVSAVPTEGRICRVIPHFAAVPCQNSSGRRVAAKFWALNDG